MRLVIVESPYAGDVERNVKYAKACIRDCLARGESPIASHLLFTQPGILDDLKPEERALGIAAGVAWYRVADCVAFYVDHGWSNGMNAARAKCLAEGILFGIRRISGFALEFGARCGRSETCGEHVHADQDACSKCG